MAKAVDAQRYIAEYAEASDALVWVDNKEKKAICDTNQTGHMTTKEWYEGD